MEILDAHVIKQSHALPEGATLHLDALELTVRLDAGAEPQRAVLRSPDSYVPGTGHLHRTSEAVWTLEMIL